jgi:hypothetical protein
MSNPKKERPLPRPHHKAFGRKKSMEHVEGQEPLLADRLAAAMAEGRVEDFLKQEMPDNEYARSLTNMMMGMTGMMPSVGGETTAQPAVKTVPEVPLETAASTEELPEDVKVAVQGGDVKGLMEILRREHLKRMPEAGQGTTSEAVPSPPQGAGLPAIDKDLIDALIRIANDNSVTLDWMIFRAIKVYVQEYQKTGRL